MNLMEAILDNTGLINEGDKTNYYYVYYTRLKKAALKAQSLGEDLKKAEKIYKKEKIKLNADVVDHLHKKRLKAKADIQKVIRQWRTADKEITKEEIQKAIIKIKKEIGWKE